MNTQQQYNHESSAALVDFQAGVISHAEWNSRQKNACEKFNADRAKEKEIDEVMQLQNPIAHWDFP